MHLTNKVGRQDQSLQPQPFIGLKLAAISLGCSKNRVDTEGILGSLKALGISLTSDYNSADIIMVNTCSFIESAQKESISTLINLFAVTRAHKPLIIAAGCLVELVGTKIIRKLPEINGAIGAHSYKHLERFIDMLLKDRRVAIKKKAGPDYCEAPDRFLTAPGHSVNIKIAEGCCNRCSYCLIPQIRGAYRSREPQVIIDEISFFLSKGAREIVLIAQDTTAYGTDRKGLPDLAGLLKDILKLDHRFWLRIMYTYPSRITGELIDLIASEPRICNYLDIPIQHASSKILRSMGRHYSREELERIIVCLRRKVPGISLRTTCMVGYPGERSRDFQELKSFVRFNKFEHLGAFIFSKQKGTTAEKLKDAVPTRVVNCRHRRLMLAQQLFSYRLNRKRIGNIEVMLVDRPLRGKKDYYFCRTEKEAPEVDGGVFVYSGEKLNVGDLLKAKIVAVQPYYLVAVKMETLNEFPFAEVN